MIYLKGVREVHGIYQVLYALWVWQEPFQSSIGFCSYLNRRCIQASQRVSTVTYTTSVDQPMILINYHELLPINHSKYISTKLCVACPGMPRAKGRETIMVGWNSICHSVDWNPICYPFGGNGKYKKHEPMGCNNYPLGIFGIHPHPNTS